MEGNVVKRMQCDKSLSLREGEAQVVAVIGDGYVMHGEIIKNIQTSHSKENIVNLCAGAKLIFGNHIYVAIQRDGMLDVIHHAEFVDKCAIKVYKSPIAL